MVKAHCRPVGQARIGDRKQNLFGLLFSGLWPTEHTDLCRREENFQPSHKRPILQAHRPPELPAPPCSGAQSRVSAPFPRPRSTVVRPPHPRPPGSTACRVPGVGCRERCRVEDVRADHVLAAVWLSGKAPPCLRMENRRKTRMLTCSAL